MNRFELEEVKENLQEIQEQIDHYVPATKWEEANNRTLKQLIKRRNELERIVENADVV